MPCPNRRPQRCAHAVVVALAIAATASAALAQRSPILSPRSLPRDVTPRIQRFQCGDFSNHYGPMDYRTADPRDRKNVETSHLEMELSTFLMGRLEGRNKAGTGGVAGGFQYTLKSFPNHPVAMKVMEELGRKLKSEQPQGTEYPLECWYVRAFETTPDDPIVRAMYGIYLSYRNRSEEAIHHLGIADRELQYSRTMQYMIGEAYFRLGRYEHAQLNAMRAASAGFPTNTLQKSLRDSGHWNTQLRSPVEAGDQARSIESSTAAASGPAH